MKTTGIYFDVEDREYFDRLGEYISINYPGFFRICNEDESRDIVITDYLNKRNSKNIITIREEGGDIEKFKRASSICMDLVKIVYGETDFTKGSGSSGPTVIPVTSALGGAGKTKISCALAKHAASTGRSVLYINLDASSSFKPVNSSKPANGLSELHYYLKSGDRISGICLKDIARPFEGGSFDCILNNRPAPDCMISPVEADRLIEAAYKDVFHEVIILDIPSFMGEALTRLMNGATKGIVITKREPEYRETCFSEYLDVHCKGKYMTVANRCSDLENSVPVDSGARTGEPFGRAIKEIYKKIRG